MLPPVEVLWNWAHLTISILTLHLLSLFTAFVLILTWVASCIVLPLLCFCWWWFLTNSQSPVYWDYIHGITWHEWRALTETSKICSTIWTKLFVQLFFMLSITHQSKIHSYRWPPCGSPNHFNHFPGPWLWESSCLLLVPADCYKNTFISAFPVLKPTFLLCLGIVG